MTSPQIRFIFYSEKHINVIRYVVSMSYLICRLFHSIQWLGLNMVTIDSYNGKYGKCVCGKEYFKEEITNQTICIGNLN